MPKRRQTVLLLIAVVLVGGFILFAIVSREPSYEGIQLSAWLRRYCQAETVVAREEAREAIRQIGTKAIPHLISALSYEEPSWVRPLQREMDEYGFSSSRLHSFFKAREEHAGEEALAGFDILGPQAYSAVPELLTLLCDSKNEDRASLAAWALGGIGQPALYPLLGALTNATPVRRWRIIWTLGRIGPNATPAIPVLIGYARAQDDKVSFYAIEALGRIQSEAPIVIPVLTNALRHEDSSVRSTAARSLGLFGQEARSSSNVLQQMLNDTNLTCRRAATNALLQIAPELLTNSPPPQSP